MKRVLTGLLVVLTWGIWAFPVAQGQIVEDWYVAFDGANRGIGVNQATGRVYISNTTDRKVHFFNFGNTTGTPDGALTHPDWEAWLGPYGVDVADDGYVYIACWTGAAKAVFRSDPDGQNVIKVCDIGAAVRGLTVYGAGVNTVIYVLRNDGNIVKCTTTDGVTFTPQILFDSNDNASIAVTADGNTIYTVGFGTPIHKWDAAGNPDTTTFVQGLAAEGSSVTAIRLSEDDSVLYVFFNDPADTTAKIGKVDPQTGALLTATTVGPADIYGSVLAFDLLDDRDIYWSSSAGYRGKATDTSVVVPNRPPVADAGPDQEVEAGTLVTLDGSGSVDIDGDPLTFLWSVVSSPEPVTFSDPTAMITTFTPNTPGDYVIQLVVNDGTVDSAPDTVVVSVYTKDLNLTFEDDSDLANWGIYTLDEKWTRALWDSTAGVAGTGALAIKDGGWGFAIERPIRATPGTPFKLTADVKTFGIDVPLPFQVVGITPDTIAVDIHTFTDYTTIELVGFATAEHGYIQIFNYNTGAGPDTVWIDNLVFDDNAPLPTYTVYGAVALSDMPADLSGSVVSFPGYEPWLSDTTDVAGAYTINGVIARTWKTLKASKIGYKDSVLTNVTVTTDTMINFTLFRNQIPVADAGLDTTGVQATSYVLLDGTGSYDPDGDPISYEWTVVSSPEDTVIMEHPDTATPGFRPMQLGDYVFQLRVFDGTDWSDPDQVTVSVTVEAPPARGYQFVDIFYQPYQGSQGAVVDPNGRLWTASYYGWNPYLRVFNPDGTEAPFSPITHAVVEGDTVEIPPENGHFYGIAIDKEGNIYYCDSYNDAVYKFDYQTGQPLGGFYVPAHLRPGAGVSPTLGVDENGYIYVGSVLGTRIMIYDSNFDSVNVVDMSWGYIGREVEVSPDGSTIFVGSFNGKVHRLAGSPTTGYTQIEDLPGPFNPRPGGTGDMSDMGFDSQGYLFVMDADNGGPDRFYIYSPDLKLRETVVLGDLTDRPRGIGFAQNDSLLYIVDFGGRNPTIQRWAIPGTKLPRLVTPLAELRVNDENGQPALMGETVRVTGIVTVSNQFGTRGPAYLQNAAGTFGLAVYDQTFVDSVEIGDEVVLEGTVDFFRGLTEIKNVTYIDIRKRGLQVEPQVISVADLADTVGENLEGLLVKLEGVHTDVSVFPSNATVTLVDRYGNTCVMFIDRDTDIPGTPVQADTFDVVGVVGQYDRTSPYWSGYQILPRSKADMPAATGVKPEEMEAIPTSFALYQNYPNPFNPYTTIKYQLPILTHVRLDIFNIMGQRVKTLVDKKQKPGYWTVRWDGTNAQGIRVASGTYIYRFKAGDFIRTRKMLLVK